jgi:hypothetical protein
MKRFVRNLTLFLLIQLVIWLAVFWVYARCRPLGQHYMAASIDKQNLLERSPSPRIVFVGGSNLAFGLDSAEVRRRLGYQPVNMGLHVELGLDFMLNEAKSRLRQGDVVVLSPEYELFGDYHAGSGEILYTALEQHPGNIKFFSWGDALSVLDNGYVIAGRIIDYDFRCLAGAKDRYDIHDPNNAYRRNGFDQYGDVIAHLELPPKIPEIPSIGSGITQGGVDRAIANINSFQEFCFKRGVRIFYSYPVVSQPYFERNKEAIEQIAAALRQESRVPMLDTPEEMYLPLDNFFDTYYHLNRAGIEKRTARLIEELGKRGIKVEPEGKTGQRGGDPAPAK